MHVITKVVRKGKSVVQYKDECAAMRRLEAENAEEYREQQGRLDAVGWNDEREIFKLLFSYGGDNPYSYAKFSADFKILIAKRDSIANGPILTETEKISARIAKLQEKLNVLIQAFDETASKIIGELVEETKVEITKLEEEKTSA